MSVSLITDGMLQDCCNIGGLRAPDGAQAVAGTAPVPPCGATAEAPALTPPAVPTRAEASGPSVPSVPCGTTGYDPTINPPEVPKGTEASEETGTEAPAVPKCPEGHET